MILQMAVKYRDNIGYISRPLLSPGRASRWRRPTFFCYITVDLICGEIKCVSKFLAVRIVRFYILVVMGLRAANTFDPGMSTGCLILSSSIVRENLKAPLYATINPAPVTTPRSL